MSKFRCKKSNISRRCKRNNLSRCVIASSVNTYTSFVIRRVRWLIRPSRGRLSCFSREGPSGHLSVTRDVTVSCIKDCRKTNAHFAFDCEKYSWESQKSRQIPRIRIRPYFKVIPRYNTRPGPGNAGWHTRPEPGSRPVGPTHPTSTKHTT